MRFVILCLLLLISTISWSQKKSILNKIQKEFESGLEWHVGSVQLRNDQQILNGSIQFSEKLQTLRFNKNESIEFLSANSVLKFDFFDKGFQKERSFISIDYPVDEVLTKKDGFLSYPLNETQNSRSATIFFELLEETKAFAILRRATPIEVLQPNQSEYTTIVPRDPTSVNPLTNNRTYARPRKPEYGQVITIYFLDLEGNMFPFIRGTRIETKDSTKMIKNNSLLFQKYDSESDIKLGNKFLAKIMGKNFTAVEEFIVSNKLKSSKVEDLLKIIEFYKTLED